MCTVVLLRRPGHAWPILLAANRDEMSERPWEIPGRHWPDRPEVVAGLDRLGGGSWLGLNDHGVVAAVLNRQGSLGPKEGKRSRGELVLEALDHADATSAAQALSEIDPAAYRSFNLVVADSHDAFWIASRRDDGNGRLEAQELPEGISMITAYDRNDPASARIRAFLPRFEQAAAPDPDKGVAGWQDWTRLLASRLHDVSRGPGAGGDEEGGPASAMTVAAENGFGTVSSSLIAVPLPALPPRRPVWLFAAGRPGEVAYRNMTL
ncbi:MAG: NRDE family protein [Alphaproteobacteria bacterium]